MALEMIVHRKRPAPRRDAGKAAVKNQRRRRRYNKMPAEEFYVVNYELGLNSIDLYEILSEFVSPSDSDPAVAVAEARDRQTGETVAVKRVRPSEGDGGAEASLCAVVREARCLLACLGHPNILQLKGVAADDSTGDLFIVTEQLLGSVGGGASTLRSRLLTRGRFSEAETRAVMRQLLTAAEAMHGAGVTHRDITPENIVIGAGGGVKVCGFRCAFTPAERLVGEPNGPPLGALRYCSPQQLMALSLCRYCPSQDVWAIGCVMAELLAGEPLFTADDEDDLLDETAELTDYLRDFGAESQVFDGALEDVSIAGRELIVGLLAFDAEDRPTAAEALQHRWFAKNDVGKAKPGVVRAYTKR